MKPHGEPALPIHCPNCQRTIYIAVAKLQNVVGIVCVSCRKQIPLTAEFREAIREK